ncbi:rod shape-determining protein MreD [Chitinophaga polysaccharea]|uniref:Rod shape-determining protein MreD n=1 Tax=Chitinophaga polysaccharea TaxID=1293035 RepID=A0A561Q4B3_9BACT|nr:MULTISPECIES: rod shape-determining protein MreD [Chitinophaga]NLR61703.1 rod shape-determining protein MreD [Chitinophaga polysaccharea]NLU92561.1 rod shape-determining protein MreD [Chitinophaga sp. Ak27]TWF45207.1 rod shape-determining protein MreD [Chitinophaga polysaccharea]
MSILLRNIIRFVLLLLIQVFVLNEILLHQLVSPYLYMLFILALPFNLPRPVLMLMGLLMGLSLDMFMNTPGMHAAACVFIAYLRPFIINILSPQGGFETTQKTPSMTSMGVSQFLIYAAILVLLHHTVFFSLEVFGTGNLLYLIMKIVFSSLASLFLIVLYELLFFSRK